MFQNLKSKLSIFLIFLNVSLALVVSVSSYFLSISVIEEDFKEHKLSTAKFIANLIDSGMYLKFSKPESVSDSGYLQYQNIIQNYFHSDKNLRQIYTLNYDSTKNKLIHSINSDFENRDVIIIECPLFKLKVWSDNNIVNISYNMEIYKNDFYVSLIKDTLNEKLLVDFSISKQEVTIILNEKEKIIINASDNNINLHYNSVIINKDHKNHEDNFVIKDNKSQIKINYFSKKNRNYIPGKEFSGTPEMYEKIINIIQANVDYIDESPNIDEDGKYLNSYAVVRDGLNMPKGIVIVEVDFSAIDEFRNYFFLISGFIFFIAIIIGIFISLLLANYFTKPLVLLTDAVETLGSGNLEALVDISSDDEFGRLAKSYNIMVSNLKIASEVQYNLITEISKLNDSLEQKVAQRTKTIQEQSRELEKQIQVAQKIQSSLLPEVIPDIRNAGVSFMYQPMMGVGGDFIDFYYRNKKELILFICDVSGHGIPAAFLATMVKMTLHTCYEKKLSPEDALQTIWKTLRGKMSGHFISAIYSKIDLFTGAMTIANAGHLPPILVSATGEVNQLIIKGRVISENIPLKVDQQKIQMNSGDKLVLYTDGVTEARNIENNMLGEERLMDILQKHYKSSPTDLCNTIYHSVLSFTGNEIKQFTDDITIMAVEYVK